MPTSERPGVYSSIEVSSALTGSGSGRTVGIAAGAGSSASVQVGTVVSVSSYAEAVERFGAESELALLIKILFVNGASQVAAVAAAVGTEPTAEEYSAAFAALMEVSGIGVMVCASHDEQVHLALKSAIEGASENGKYRIGVVEAPSAAAELAQRAEELNCESLVMVGPCACGSDAAVMPGVVSAAVAGQIASCTDPALPLNGAQLYGVQALKSACTDSEIDMLVRSGVTPVENVNGEFFVVRGVTTRTTTAGAADSTWHELTTVMIINDVIPTVRDALRTRFARSKNTAQTRGAIRTQVVIELENKLAREIIDSYGAVSAQASAEDPTLCEVSFEFTVAHGLNKIGLTAHITV